MSEGPDPIAREWQRALGLQDCMVLVGGRLDIPDFEPIPITNDTMCSAVEILWSRPRPGSHPPSGAPLETLLQNDRLSWSWTGLMQWRFTLAYRAFRQDRNVLICSALLSVGIEYEKPSSCSYSRSALYIHLFRRKADPTFKGRV